MPYLGLCLGLQMAVVEFARNVCGLRDASSTEFDEELRHPTPHPVIHLMPSQETVRWKGRHDAPGRLSLPPGARTRWRIALYGEPTSASGTGTGTR